MLHARAFSLGFGVVLAAGPALGQDSFNDFFWSPRVSTGFDYSAGKFGEAQTTEIAFVPLSIQTARGPFTFKLAGGWLSVAGPALILDGAGVSAAKPGVSRHASGVSDTTLSAMYSIESLYDRGVYIDFSTRVKLPSASFKKGLGTGKLDGAVQLDAAAALGDVMPFLTLGYKVNGARETLKTRNVAYGTLGVQYAWDERVATGLTYDYRQSSLRTSADPEEASLYLSYRVSDAWSFNAYGVVGLSRNSPDAGAGVTFTYRFAPSETFLPFTR